MNKAERQARAKESNRRRILDPHATAAIRLLILTGARLREILHAKWEHVDFERGVILLPDSKTGKKTIYLSAAALEILAGLPRLAGNPYVFPGGVEGKPRADLKKPWAAVAKAAGLEGVRIHDLRHSFASSGRARPWACRSSASSRSFAARHDCALRSFGRGPDAPSGRDDRRNDRGRGRRVWRREREAVAHAPPAPFQVTNPTSKNEPAPCDARWGLLGKPENPTTRRNAPAYWSAIVWIF